MSIQPVASQQDASTGLHSVKVKGSGEEGGSAGSSATKAPTTVTTINADGSTTTVTTNADGSTSTTTTPPAARAGGSASLLDGSNSGQLSTLLSAQEQSVQGRS